AGHDELAVLGPEAVESIRDEAGLSGTDWEHYFNGLDKDGSPTAYIFRCLHCGEYGGYSDCD
ncbi:MAG TPA: CbrC family protein, partial [Chloroflexia bacterium]|nr:CbrC family protein [Chloroflexia bacterium]